MERMVAALTKEGADSEHIAAFRQAATRGRGGHTNGKQPNRNKSQKCRSHARYGDRAYTCMKGNCPDRNKPLPTPPEGRRKKGEAAPVDESLDT